MSKKTNFKETLINAFKVEQLNETGFNIALGQLILYELNLDRSYYNTHINKYKVDESKNIIIDYYLYDITWAKWSKDDSRLEIDKEFKMNIRDILEKYATFSII